MQNLYLIKECREFNFSYITDDKISLKLITKLNRICLSGKTTIPTIFIPHLS
jgi:hypothetical protein